MKFDNPQNPYIINENKVWNWYYLEAHGWNLSWNDSGRGICIYNTTDGDGEKQCHFYTDIDKWDDELKVFLENYFSQHKEELLDKPLRFLTRLSPTWRKGAKKEDKILTEEDMPLPEWIKRPENEHCEEDISIKIRDIPHWQDPNWKRTVVCCKNHRDIDACLTFSKFVVRWANEGGHFSIKGIYEAQKPFKCVSLDPADNCRNVNKGEYVLVVDGLVADATNWRLRRAARSEEESHISWCWTGIPLKDNACMTDDETAEYLKKLDINLPVYDEEILPVNQISDDYVCFHHILYNSEQRLREDNWMYGKVRKVTEEDFANKPLLRSAFKQMLQCKSGAELQSTPNIMALVKAMIKIKEDADGLPEEPGALVLSVINGSNNHWRCGIWCDMPVHKGHSVKMHPIDKFCLS